MQGVLAAAGAARAAKRASRPPLSPCSSSRARLAQAVFTAIAKFAEKTRAPASRPPPPPPAGAFHGAPMGMAPGPASFAAALGGMSMPYGGLGSARPYGLAAAPPPAALPLPTLPVDCDVFVEVEQALAPPTRLRRCVGARTSPRAARAALCVFVCGSRARAAARAAPDVSVASARAATRTAARS